MAQGTDSAFEDDLPIPWIWRTLVAVEKWARPVWGWGALLACMLLAMLPAVSLRSNRWLDLGDFQRTLEWVGPLAVATVWWLWGWRRQRHMRFGRLAIVATALVGILIVSQLLLGWMPGPRSLFQAVITADWIGLATDVGATWMRAFTRFQLWREGVAAGGAAQDNLVFAAFGSVILWIVGALTAWLARSVCQGFAAAVPSLWLLGAILLYSSSGRYLLLIALTLTLALHIVLDQAQLTTRWQRLGLDYSPGLLVDRLLTAAGAAALILTLAAVMPNLYFQPLVTRYYTALAPIHVAFEEFSERLFPELHATSRVVGGGGSGMPNEFLLQGGPNLGSEVVMRVRTDEAAAVLYPFDEMAAPPSHYMRGRTLTQYDGLGWRDFDNTRREEMAANRRWVETPEWGRKQVVQSVILEQNSTILFAAPEPVESSTAVRVETRGENDLVAVLARDTSYTVVSMVPALDEAMLRALPRWAVGEEVGTDAGLPLLPAEMAVHLALPESVTERTRALAEELVAGRESAYDKALAIEQYLRQYAYDLEVDAPPAEVTDVADYFLFDLQRGYCDYYASAFVVLARLAGLPSRFATGYASGQWDPAEGVFVIRESDAHSWPEVYFPEVGWIPFEPTAGRAQLTRVALPTSNAMIAPPPALPTPPAEQEVAPWNWQPVVWLIPFGGLVWLLLIAVQSWQRRREDPWISLLKWGHRLGRPMAESETVLEYGRGLAGYVLHNQSRAQDAGRVAAREIQAVSEQVNTLRYGPDEERAAAKVALHSHWSRLRTYLRTVRMD